VKILFSTRPAYGHVYPLLPLADAARRAGHQVNFATAGCFLTPLDRLGYPTHEVGLTIEAAHAELLASVSADVMPRGADGRPDVEMGGRLFLDVIAPRTAADLAPVLARLEPDVVVFEQYDVGAAVAAHAAGIAAVGHALSPRFPDELVRAMAGDHLERLWARHGGTPSSFDVFTGDAYVDIFPTALQQPSFLSDPARVPMRAVPYAEPEADLPEWVDERDRPLVYLSLGTVVSTDEVLRPVIEGLAPLDVDILVALGSADGSALGTVPPNVHVESFVDQPGALSQAELAVHHGGSGTILGALAYGTPQLVLPKGADQFWNADLMARAGLAEVLEPPQVTPDAVTRAAAAELGHHRPAVDAVSAEIAAMPHPADVLEELVSRIGRRSGAPAAQPNEVANRLS
jgi:UDP:flavonoid glycosyltransferase YjiC (YdhE family)